MCPPLQDVQTGLERGGGGGGADREQRGRNEGSGENANQICIRPSVDGLYRDGTVHISREMHKQCFITRPEMTRRAPKPHRHRSRTFL